jgi:hypothetical protein
VLPGSKKNVVTFGTQTATATKPDGRGIYDYASTTGGRVFDHIAIINYSSQSATLLVRPEDAVNTAQGGFAALPLNDRSSDVGTWILLPSPDLTITLPPRSDVIVPFAVEVPKNATPGDHAGVITATLQSSIISKSGQRVKLLQTVGTRMFIRVSGPLHPGFTVKNLQVKYEGTSDPIGTGKVNLTYTVDNTGNVALGGRQTVYVTGLFGSKKSAKSVAQVQLLLPGFSVKEHVSISGVYPEIRDSGHVSITPLYIPGSVQPASGPYEASIGFWAIPWTLVLIIVGIILLVVLWFIYRRRRRKGPDKGGGVPPAPDAAAAAGGTDSEGSSGPPPPPGDETETARPGTKEPAPVASEGEGG